MGRGKGDSMLHHKCYDYVNETQLMFQTCFGKQTCIKVQEKATEVDALFPFLCIITDYGEMDRNTNLRALLSQFRYRMMIKKDL